MDFSPLLREASKQHSTNAHWISRDSPRNWGRGVMTQYHTDLPTSCPPGSASSTTADLYKAIDGRQPSVDDFKSFAEKGREGIDKSLCQSWGLSVWPSMAAVNHALKTYKVFRKKRIIKFSITPLDGSLAITPSAQQPEHHTFWKYTSCNLLNSCQLIDVSGKEQ